MSAGIADDVDGLLCDLGITSFPATSEGSSDKLARSLSARLRPSSSLMSTTLIHMGPAETGAAVEMFDDILEWTNLPRGFSNRARHGEIVNSIARRTQGIEDLRDELYLQLLKQTRGNVTHYQKWSVWKLFRILAERLACSTDLAHCLMPYIERISSDAKEDPMVRMLACAILDAIRKHHALIDVMKKQSSNRRIKSDEITVCHVLSADDRSVEVAYDRKTLVADGVEQAAWSVGIQNWKNFTLFLDEDIYLDSDAHLAAVLSAGGIQEDGHQVRVHFKQILFREAKAEMLNADYVRLSYRQLRQEYLNTHFPVIVDDVLKLCIAQILFEYGSDAFSSETGLFNKIRGCVPKAVTVQRSSSLLSQCFAGEKYIDWAKEARDYFAKKSLMIPEDPRRWFLEMIHTQRYGESTSFSVQLVECNHRKLSEEKTSSAVVTPRSIDFFDQDFTQCQLSMKMQHIRWCSSSDKEVVLVRRRHVRTYRIRMKMFNANLFRRLVIAYSIKANCDREQPKHTAAEPPLGGETDRDQNGCLDSKGSVSLEGDSDTEDESSSPRSLEHSSTEASPRLGRSRTSSASLVLEPFSPYNHEYPPNEPSPYSNPPPPYESPCSAPNVRGLRRCLSATEVTQSGSLDALNTLTKETYFAQSYLIKSKSVNRKAHVFFAENINTGDPVVLKFYTNRLLYDNSLKMHRKLRHSDHVCKLLNNIEYCEYPPCLVFERGHDTLEYWMKKARPSKMDRRSVLDQILAALVDIHSHNVVHRDLKPSNVIFFNDVYKWKLIDFDSAATTWEGEQIHATPAYAAPEIIEAAFNGKKEIAVDAFADMWSFGIIAFEMLKGTRFYGDCSSLEDVRDRQSAEHINSTIECLEEKQEKSLVKNLLRIKPMERQTAAKARTKGIFDSGLDTSQMAAGRKNDEQKFDEILRCVTLTLQHMDLANLAVAIDVVELISDNDIQGIPFHCCEAREVPTMADDFLPQDPIFILKCRQKHRVSIYLHPIRGGNSPIREVLSVEATLKDGSRAQLEMIQEEDRLYEGNKVVALLDPGSFDPSDLLNVACPMFGDATVRFVSVKLTMKFVTRDTREQTSLLEHTIFCNIVTHDSTMIYQKFKRVLESGWRNVPQWMRDCGRFSLSLANIGLNAV